MARLDHGPQELPDGRYRDKDLSFTDCTSFILMRELKVREALTTDHHFLQAGFGIKPGRDGRA